MKKVMSSIEKATRNVVVSDRSSWIRVEGFCTGF